MCTCVPCNQYIIYVAFFAEIDCYDPNTLPIIYPRSIEFCQLKIFGYENSHRRMAENQTMQHLILQTAD